MGQQISLCRRRLSTSFQESAKFAPSVSHKLETEKVEEDKIQELLESSTQVSEKEQVLTKFVDSSLYTQALENIAFASVEKLPEPHYKVKCENNGIQRQKRMQTEVKLMQKNLPTYASNAIYVRGDDQDQNHQRALITGSDSTPYAGGCFLFEIAYPNEFPNSPPKMEILTTANHGIRFNPNLYDSGYVCLSLLGTWSGSAEESWNPAVSTVMHILMSIQSLVMNEDVIYQEPCYNSPANKTNPEVVKMNEGYKNVVKFGTVKYAMNDMIENPPAEFKDVIMAHFYLNRKKILQTVQEWLDYHKNQAEGYAAYTGLTQCHNHGICGQFLSSKDAFPNMLSEEFEKLKKHLEIMTYKEIYRIPCIRERHIEINDGQKLNDSIQNPEDIQRVKIELTAIEKYRKQQKVQKKKRLGKW